MKFRFTSVAERTLSDVIDFYNLIDEESDTNLASRVYLTVSDALSRLLVFPYMGHLYNKKRGVFRFNLDFNLGVFYKLNSDELVVLAIIDLRQDPSGYNALLEI